MKTVVFVVATGNHAWFDATLPRLGKLARMLGADFHVAHDGCKGVAPTWMKLALMHRYTSAERLIVLDADLMPNFRKIEPEDLSLLTQEEAALSPDHGSPVRNERFQRWCRENLNADAEIGTPYYNAGVMSFSWATVNALVSAFDKDGRTPDRRFHEQDWINFHLSDMGIPITALPQEMNWIAPQFRQASLNQAKIIHFAGGHKDLIPAYDRDLPQ